MIDGDQCAKLEEMFTEEEILGAVSELNGDKAPGPDGFPLAFWSFSWEFVKEEVMGFFKEFYQNDQFVKSLNATFLVLVPKCRTVEDLKDLRPISLVGSLYKILSKVLANRIKRVMSLIISQSQNAFVEGRQILDAVLIANEAVDSTLRGKKKGILCKLDIEKAYDHIRWDFLLKMLERMGFGPKWIRWINWCISTATFSVLINGSSTGFFRSSRGLRQGDPLSPYLFVIGMEALSCLLKRAVEDNFITGCRFGGRDGGEIVISHLLYADDTIIFCDANAEQMMYLRWTLMWFEAFSGLKINLIKSEIIPLGRVDNVEELAAELGCGVGGPSPLSTWASPLALLTGLQEFGTLSKKDLEINCPLGKNNTYQRAGDLPSFEVLCLAYLFTSSLCLEYQRLFGLDWKRFKETFFGVAAI